MQQGKLTTPKLTKKAINASSPTLLKDKHYLPSRYGLDPIRSTNNMQSLLNTIELNIKQEPKLKPNSPVKLKIKPQKKIQTDIKKGSAEFKPKPLKRQQSDMQNFKQIFLEPRQQALNTIQQKQKNQQIIYAKQICKDYQKLLHFEKGNSPSPNKQKPEEISEKQVKRYYDQCIELLQKQPQHQKSKSASSFDNFYSQQIRVEPPDMPNSTIASSISPGSGYAPSVPLLPSKKGILTQLLMRAKAGINTEDIEKQAHLAFYLGMVYEQKRSFSSAVKFYKRFLGFAKALQDKIGMALGANRVAINLFYDNHTSKSIAFHHQNLKLSDNENCFAAYYNLGICHRSKGEFEQALSFLETALQWSKQKGDSQSQCITYGQIAITFKEMQYFQKSLQNFEQSVDICRKLQKVNLLQQNLHHMILITSNYNLSSFEKVYELSTQAYECSKILQQKINQQIFGCNIGIILGYQQFAKRRQSEVQEQQLEEFQLTEDQLQVQSIIKKETQDNSKENQEQVL